MKILPVRAELFDTDRQTDGRTDVTKLVVLYIEANSRFYQFCEIT